MEWVLQQDQCGCCIACIAMILECTYAEAHAMVKPAFEHAKLRGISTAVVEEVLARAGYACRTFYERYRPMQNKATILPLAPFAHIHFCGGKTARSQAN